MQKKQGGVGKGVKDRGGEENGEEGRVRNLSPTPPPLV